MGRYFLKRVLGTIPLMLVISFIIFMFVHMIPGDPARIMAGKDATLEEINRTRQALGLDQPLMKQYLMYLDRMFHGDLGTSTTTGQSVAEMIGPRFLPTFTLAGCALVWSLIIGVLLGVLSAVMRGKWEDYIGMLIAISGISIPVFWLGLVLIQIFSVQLGWLPTGGLDSMQSYI
ncbi:MAG: glutathione ABC transporter permease GsiC, partial [Clostridiales bacterium]|nr:glutathione ABC transporter permease GsiC [Clostridiales bacterium]